MLSLLFNIFQFIVGIVVAIIMLIAIWVLVENFVEDLK